MRHDVFELTIKMQKALILADEGQLKRLGVDDSRYRELLYTRTQAIGAAAAFLGFDGFIVPSARRDRSEARRVGKECVRRVDPGGRRTLKKKNPTPHTPPAPAPPPHTPP